MMLTKTLPSSHLLAEAIIERQERIPRVSPASAVAESAQISKETFPHQEVAARWPVSCEAPRPKTTSTCAMLVCGHSYNLRSASRSSL